MKEHIITTDDRVWAKCEHVALSHIVRTHSNRCKDTVRQQLYRPMQQRVDLVMYELLNKSVLGL